MKNLTLLLVVCLAGCAMQQPQQQQQPQPPKQKPFYFYKPPERFVTMQDAAQQRFEEWLQHNDKYDGFKFQ